MSRWPGDRVRIRIDADTCAVEAAGQSQRIPFAIEATDWPAALAAHVPPGARVAVCVADHYARYLVVQWPAGVRARREREAWLGHQFKRAHGLEMSEWTVAIDRDAVNDPRIACALPSSLLARLDACVATRKAAIVSLTGAFIDDFNRARRGIHAADGALAVTRAQRMTLGIWRDGQWQRVASQVVESGDSAAAQRMLTQLRVTGEAPASGVLYAAGESMQAPAGWTATQATEPVV